MKPKEKPCKGIGKAKGFGGCGELQSIRTHGLGHKCGCYPKWLYSTPQGQEKLNKSIIKATEPKRQLQQAIEADKDKKRLGQLLEGARIACHTYIRIRDKGKSCISCGAPWESDFQAGHWYKAELYSNLKFNEFNIMGQCKRCNLFLDGNFQEYSNRIGTRIGEDKKKEIELQAKSFKSMNWKWDKEELTKIRKYYQTKLKELKKDS